MTPVMPGPHGRRPGSPVRKGGEVHWHVGIEGPPLAVVLDNGSVLYPSEDSEGNGPGCFWVLGPHSVERLDEGRR